MKKVIFILATMLVFLNSYSQQEDKSKRPSPPVTVSGKIGAANVTVDYSQPSIKGRKVWGELVPFGEVWRTGANEATIFTTDKDILVEGKVLKAGTYSFFTIPNKEDWTIIFNNVAHQWGAYKYDVSKDALRVNVKPTKSESFNEKLSYNLDKGHVIINWENLKIPVSLKQS